MMMTKLWQPYDQNIGFNQKQSASAYKFFDPYDIRRLSIFPRTEHESRDHLISELNFSKSQMVFHSRLSLPQMRHKRTSFHPIKDKKWKSIKKIMG